MCQEWLSLGDGICTIIAAPQLPHARTRRRSASCPAPRPQTCCWSGPYGGQPERGSNGGPSVRHGAGGSKQLKQRAVRATAYIMEPCAPVCMAGKPSPHSAGSAPVRLQRSSALAGHGSVAIGRDASAYEQQHRAVASPQYSSTQGRMWGAYMSASLGNPSAHSGGSVPEKPL